jgi:SAM-dependent methyltransferase
MWELDAYRAISPGEEQAQTFLSQAKPIKDSTCIDFGCGTGRGGLMVALFGNMIVTLIDFAENALDPEVKNATVTQPHRISWLQHDLNKPIPKTASYGFCTDVMEHIPPEEVDTVLTNILNSASRVFFQISCQEDRCGALADEELHLSIQTYGWWVKKFREHNAVIHWSREDENGNACQIYATAWANQDTIEYEGAVNTQIEIVMEHVKENAKTDWQMIHPHKLQNKEVMIICGGPSLSDYTDEIIELRAKGMPMITTNGTYNWAIMNGMKPSMQLVIDAREFNTRFVRPIVDDCKFMIASQCHPKVFEGLPQDRTFIWHVTGGQEVPDLLDELYEIWFPCPGGSTVTLRGLCLLRMLGFHKIHMYGFDSCYRDDEHHAYDQPENDYGSNRTLPVSVGGKVFWCDPWMYCQAKEWMQMVGLFGDEIDLDVKGDGLIAHIIKTGATLSALEDNEE